MKSITLHNLDEQLAALIEQKAKATGKSLNKVIKELLSQALGVSKSTRQEKEEEFKEFFGVWNKEDEEEFKKNTKDLNAINPDDWK